MTILLQLFLFLLFPFQATDQPGSQDNRLHPFYVSVTEITQNSAARSLEVSCKFFADDFEETLQNAYKIQLDITAENERPTFDKLIPDYVGKRLQLVADGKTLVLKYVGYERDKESVYCYFEVLDQPTVKSLSVMNALLHDFKPEQINIMHVTVGGKRQSAKLDYPTNKAGFKF
ncbi:MAG TPA: DUF6702 family protein [Flavisolibacter sp.]|jgi:hypothetical protein|nr:DUF6702 family protein [Flavisolibacter sp.]